MGIGDRLTPIGKYVRALEHKSNTDKVADQAIVARSHANTSIRLLDTYALATRQLRARSRMALARG
jgi:hypothetical protein